ncbi:MAG TPA: penicillin-binding protein [Marinilabiliales bacterium]|nr:penicillin-binding protein [Marinilabiliales bacterium]
MITTFMASNFDKSAIMAKTTTTYFKKQVLAWSIIIFPLVMLFMLFFHISKGNLGFMPSFEELENPKSNLASEVYSEDGILLGTFFKEKENRSRIEYSDISPYLVDALIATEDERFLSHSGVDFRGLIRVFVRTVLLGNESSGGGSTISQQLAKMLFPREEFSNPIQKVNRKFREWVIAIKLERSYTKEEIIAMYFNQFDFLYQAVGIKNASMVYFSCGPNELKIEQAAMLVGMAKNPSLFNPVRRPEQALQRRNIVFLQMLKNNKITKQEYDSLKQIPLETRFQRIDHTMGKATYFREYLRMTMNASKPEKDNYYNPTTYIEDSVEWETNPLYGWCNKNFKLDGEPYSIYKDGLRIYTTVNSKMQDYAEEAVSEHLRYDLQVAFDYEKKYQKTAPFSETLTQEEVNNLMTLGMKRSERYRVLKNQKIPMDSIIKNFKTRTEMTVFSWRGEIDTVMTPMDSIKYYKHFLLAGFMAMDPRSGFVKAYVGGIDYKHFQYDHVVQAKRQIGSTFKPFLYTLAMRDGYSPCYQVPNVPITLTDPSTGEPWTPKGGGNEKYERKMVSLRFGLRQSLNNITAWLMGQFGPKAVIDIARNMGVKSEIPEVLSICLGVADLSLYEMVGAYSSFANKGVYTQPVFVTRIEDKNGNLLATFTPRKNEAINEKTAYLMIDMLKGVANKGTAVRLRNDTYQIYSEVAAKTGTTQNQSDGWFIGITPNLVSGVWTGAEDRATHFDGLSLGQGANMALPVWAIFMNKVYNDGTLGITREDTFEKPADYVETPECVDILGEDESGESNEEIPEEVDF